MKLRELADKATTHVRDCDEQAVPVNLGLLARNAAEFNAELVEALTSAGVISPAPVIDLGAPPQA
jgi:hypothetical protein